LVAQQENIVTKSAY